MHSSFPSLEDISELGNDSGIPIPNTPMSFSPKNKFSAISSSNSFLFECSHNLPCINSPHPSSDNTTISEKDSSEGLYPSDWRTCEYQGLIFNKSANSELFYNHLIRTYEGLNHAKSLMKLSSFYSQTNEKKPIELSSTCDPKKKCLFFELEDVLVRRVPHSAERKSFSIETFEKNGVNTQQHFQIRPYVPEALKLLSKSFNMVVFTQMPASEAIQIVKALDPQKCLFRTVLSQNRCFATKMGTYMKDLRMITDRSLQELVIIDSDSFAYSFHEDNGVPLLTWEGDEDDSEIFFLTAYLLKLKDAKDVRKVNKEQFKLKKLTLMNIKEVVDLF